MKSKFIEGTNEQYSIRDDGVVTRHYKHTRGKLIIKNFNLKVDSNGIIVYYNHNEKNRIALQYLLFDYFGFRFCKKCNNKFSKKRENKLYNSCLKPNNYAITPEKIKEKNAKVIKNITRSYVASMLKVKVTELSDELYELYKAQLLVKRKLAEKMQVSIATFNK